VSTLLLMWALMFSRTYVVWGKDGIPRDQFGPSKFWSVYYSEQDCRTAAAAAHTFEHDGVVTKCIPMDVDIKDINPEKR
jgi:hypothetical protein